MKILAVCGSPRRGANTETYLRTILTGATEQGAETRYVNVAHENVRGCIGCMHCRTHAGCGLKDAMQGIYEDIAWADLVIIGFPVYMYQVNAQTKAFLDRLFPYMNDDYTSKISKRAILVGTQGNPDEDVHRPWIEGTVKALGLMGFKVEKTIMRGGLFAKEDARGNAHLIEEATSIGRELVSQGPSNV